MEDLTETPDGLRVLIRHSKTDQEGQGQEVAIPRGYRLRPVEAVQAWLAARGDHRGPSVPARAERQRLQAVALKAPSVAVIVQRYATLAGHAAGFAGHSLRSGFLTSGAEAVASIFKMMGGCYGVGRAGASPGGAEGGAMAEALRQAEAVRKARGLLARLQAELRGE